MTTRHVVWDWNGTLLDDLGVVIEAASASLGSLGMPPISEDDYRDHFTRPVRAFYDSLFGRAVTDIEWEQLNNNFHDAYYSKAPTAELTVDTLAALDAVDDLGWHQSLLSMSDNHWLKPEVDRRGITDRFRLVDGLKVQTGGLKAEHMKTHIDDLDVAPSRVVVVGDTPDDAAAARHVGAAVVLYDGGSHHLPHLQGMGAPVAHTLLEAVEIAQSL